MVRAAFTEFLLPDGADLEAAQASLSAHLRLETGAVELVDRTFYDTVDGRLHGSGIRLAAGAGCLVVLDASGEVARAPANGHPPWRLLAVDLPAGRLRQILAPIIEMRAVTPVARIRSRLLPLRVLNGEAKTVVRLVLEEPSLVAESGAPTRLSSRLHAYGVRGYDAALNRVTGALEHGLGFRAAASPLFDLAVTESGGVPGGVSSKLDVPLQPDQRADSAAGALLVRLAGTIEQNLPGVLADIDSEFLHDLRVAVRRTRSAQRQLRHVFPAERLAWFRGEFRWLQQVTGPTRDLDVHLLEFEELGSMLPQQQSLDLEPLRALLLERRRREQRRMLGALRFSRTQELLAEWSIFLEGLVEAPLDDRPDAARPIVAVAGERIRAVYRRIVEAGRGIDDNSPPEALHDLRKSAKELRYLLEFFAAMYPAEVVAPMVGTLKDLQDTLGRFYDREMQAETLRSLGHELALRDDGPAGLLAIGFLAARLADDQAAARSEFAERFAAFAAKPQRALVRRTFT